MTIDFGGQGEIAFEKRGRAGLVRLTRPAALNALSHSMVRALRRALVAWEGDPEVHCVVVEGEGRAFCAGGDILAVYHATKAGAAPYDFFADEYRLNAHIKRYPKPYVALIDGIVMGGGVGISVHGSHRVVTENALFAMPEVGIGFFPDVGGSAFLPHMPDEFGLYLALTGNRIRQGDCLASGFATHAIAAEDKIAIREKLVETGDPDKALAGRTIEKDFETPADTRRTITACFGADTLEECLKRLSSAEAQGDEAAMAFLATLGSRSPTSLQVTFRQVRQGKALTMDDCMRMEFRIVARMLEGHDLFEGIRATLIDKGDTPKWQPANLSSLKPETVDHYFASLTDRELTLP
ncbi:MAG: enoyl-CoA hydratase/isomerase family protein [Phyllobacterium sp.]